MKRIRKENSIFTMSKEHTPTLNAASGEMIVFETFDCYCSRIKGQEDAQSDGPGNPATGSLYVEGAETGDILKVEILDIKTAPQGIMRIRPGVGTYGDYVIKNKTLPLPMVVEGEHVMTLASCESLDDAVKQASINMHKFLTQEFKMDTHEAAMLLSIAGELKICQIVDPLITSRMELPLYALEKYNYKMI